MTLHFLIFALKAILNLASVPLFRLNFFQSSADKQTYSSFLLYAPCSSFLPLRSGRLEPLHIYVCRSMLLPPEKLHPTQKEIMVEFPRLGHSTSLELSRGPFCFLPGFLIALCISQDSQSTIFLKAGILSCSILP